MNTLNEAANAVSDAAYEVGGLGDGRVAGDLITAAAHLSFARKALRDGLGARR